MQQQIESIIDTPSPQRQVGLDHLTRRIAQALYEARGCVEGHALDDWLKAQTLVESTLSDLAQVSGSCLSLSLADLDQRRALIRRPSADLAMRPWLA